MNDYLMGGILIGFCLGIVFFIFYVLLAPEKKKEDEDGKTVSHIFYIDSTTNELIQANDFAANIYSFIGSLRKPHPQYTLKKGKYRVKVEINMSIKDVAPDPSEQHVEKFKIRH